MTDPFFDQGPVHVRGTERKGKLGQLRPDINPVRLDVRDIIEHEAGDGDGAQIIVSRRPFLMLAVTERGCMASGIKTRKPPVSSCRLRI